MDTTQLLKGVLDAAVLAIVQREDGYGYDVVRRLRDAGLDEVGDASVYGTLRRLYAAGALSTYVVPSEGGPHRKYYSITPVGLELLETQRRSWASFSAILTELITPASSIANDPATPQAPDASAASDSAVDTAGAGADGTGADGTDAAEATDLEHDPTRHSPTLRPTRRAPTREARGR